MSIDFQVGPIGPIENIVVPEQAVISVALVVAAAFIAVAIGSRK